MFILQIQCANIDEAMAILASVKRGTTVEMLKPATEQLAFSDPAGLSDAESPAAKHFPDTTNVVEPKKRGRPRREVAAPPAEKSASAEVQGSAPAPESEPEVQTQTLTEASIRDALKSVQAKYGEADMSKPLDILGKFHAGRISEVQPNDYPAFIAACEAA